MKCKICLTEYYLEEYDTPNPAEPCWCGEMCNCSPYEWNGIHGVLKYIRYRLAEFILNQSNKIADWLTQRKV